MGDEVFGYWVQWAGGAVFLGLEFFGDEVGWVGDRTAFGWNRVDYWQVWFVLASSDNFSKHPETLFINFLIELISF